jgi:hypothetical protein
VEEHLDELAFLAETLGAKTVYRFKQKMDKPDIRTFVGKGKLEEIQTYIEHFAVDMVIFDDDLSPSQMRNLENELKIKIYDRSLPDSGYFLAACPVCTSQNSGGTGTISIPLAPIDQHVDSLGAAARRNGHPRRIR